MQYKVIMVLQLDIEADTPEEAKEIAWKGVEGLQKVEQTFCSTGTVLSVDEPEVTV